LGGWGQKKTRAKNSLEFTESRRGQCPKIKKKASLRAEGVVALETGKVRT